MIPPGMVAAWILLMKPWLLPDPNPFPKFTFLTWRRRGDKR